MDSSVNKKRYREIDALRGFAIFLVIFGHAIIVHPINLHDDKFWLSIFNFISSVHLPLFYVVSGLCFSYKNNYLDYVVKKTKRLVIPFIIFNLFDFSLRTIFPFLVNRKITLSEFASDVFIYGGEYEFLYILFVIFLIYPLIFKLRENRYISYVIDITVVLLNIIGINSSICCIGRVSKFLLFFHIGCRMKDQIFKMFNKKIDIKYQTLAFIVWVTLFCLPDNSIINTLTSLAGVLTCVLFANNSYFISLFERYGKISLQLYLCNGFLLVLSRTIICRLTSISVVIVLFNVVIDFFVSYICIKFVLERSKLARVLTGEI